MIRDLFMLGALALLQSAGAATGPVGFAQDVLLAHQVAGETSVEVPAAARDRHGEVDVRVTIGVDGSVTDARVARGGTMNSEDAGAALAAARRLKFRPFSYRGNPVIAVGTLPIRYVAKGEGGRRDPDAALPPIDYAHLRITLVRSACFGSCPDYRVTIDGAGNVVFTTEADSVPGAAEVHRAFSMGTGVLVGGTHRTSIDRATLDALIGRFRAAHFFGLRESYRAPITDNPAYVVGFDSGGQHWEVVDYVGRMVGMPAAVSELENAIDEAAGTATWVKGDARTVPALIAAGLDPKGEDAATLAMASLWMYRANGRVALDLLAAGLPLNRTVKWPDGSAMALGEALHGLVARGAQPRLLAMLAARGWPPDLTPAEREAVFIKGGGGCDIDTARAMIASGVRINAVLDPSDGNDHRDTLLENAVASNGPCDDLPDRGAYVSALIALGADPNLRDNLGRTAIFGVDDEDVLHLLLVAGARADITGNDKRSPALFVASDAIVLQLLEAGADPRGRASDPYGRPDHDGKTLREMAQDGDMPATLAWLDAHGVQ